MTPERWQQIRELLHGAMQLPVAERSAFLYSKCSNDPALRSEVESFLSAEGDVSRDFLEKPIVPRITYKPGTRLGPYEVVSFIGAGGMGEVYQARDSRLDRIVAIKVLPTDLSAIPQHRERFQREAKAISALQHPNICTLHDVGQQDNSQYLVMEYLEGETLAERLTKGRLQLDLTLRYAMEVADALETAHRRGIVHRDLKPGNIFLTTHGESKVLDFGLAKLEDSRAPANSLTTLTSDPKALTTPGVAMGTVAYMSPEQARGEELDARTDIFSLGAVLYEMITGKPAFRGKTSAVVFKAIFDETPLPPTQVVPDLPASLDHIVERALEKDRGLRYQSAADLRVDLQRLQRNSQSGKTAAQQTSRPRKLTLAAAVPIVVLAGLLGGWLLRSRGSTALTSKDTVVLAEFTNATGDPVFDDTLRQGLSAQLDQSPFLNLLTDRRIAYTLERMEQPSGTRLTYAVALEVCKRTGSAAAIAGSIAKLGNQYVLGLKAVTCSSENPLANVQVTADRKEEVLKVLGVAGTKLRQKLGESLSTREKFDTPLEEVTTSSLEALNAYTLGRKARRKTGSAAAIPFYRQAVQIDPNFATAELALGGEYANISELDEAEHHLLRAYELRDRLSARERFNVESTYFEFAERNLVRAAEIYKLWAETYPLDPDPHDGLGNAYIFLGQLPQALEELETERKLARGGYYNYYNLVVTYVYLGRIKQARETAEEMLAEKMEPWAGHYLLYVISFLEGNREGMKQELAWGTERPDDEMEFLLRQSDTAAYEGRAMKAWKLSQRAAAAAQRDGEKENVALNLAYAALREAEFEHMQHVAGRAKEALSLENSRNVKILAALALARAGGATEAEKLAEELSKSRPADTVLNKYWVPIIRGAAELRQNKDEKAIEELEVAAPYELGAPDPVGPGTLYPAYLRGIAYLRLKQPEKAAVEFQKLIDYRGCVQNYLLGAMVHLQMARAAQMKGEKDKARAKYQDFLTLWKDADPDIPILKQAKAEYAKLN